MPMMDMEIRFPGKRHCLKLSRSLSGVEAIFLASAPLSQWFILPDGA
jgi:hypothetical protein